MKKEIKRQSTNEVDKDELRKEAAYFLGKVWAARLLETNGVRFLEDDIYFYKILSRVLNADSSILENYFEGLFEDFDRDNIESYALVTFYNELFCC